MKFCVNSSPTLGPPSAPSAITAGADGFTGLQVNVTIPDDMTSVCVDRYRAFVEGIQTVPTLTQRVLDASETVYTFRFPVDLCRDVLSPAIRVSAAAITNGVVGPNITRQGPVDNLNRSGEIFRQE